MHVDVVGGAPAVLVQSGASAGWDARQAQRPLAERFTLVVPTRSGYPPNRPLE